MVNEFDGQSFEKKAEGLQMENQKLKRMVRLSGIGLSVIAILVVFGIAVLFGRSSFVRYQLGCPDPGVIFIMDTTTGETKIFRGHHIGGGEIEYGCIGNISPFAQIEHVRSSK